MLCFVICSSCLFCGLLLLLYCCVVCWCDVCFCCVFCCLPVLCAFAFCRFFLFVVLCFYAVMSFSCDSCVMFDVLVLSFLLLCVFCC